MNKLSEEFLNNLNIEAKNYYNQSTNDAIQRSDIWISNFQGLYSIMNLDINPVEKINEILKHQFYSSGITYKEITEKEIQWNIDYLKENYNINIDDLLNSNIAESEFYNKKKSFTYNNELLSSDFFRHLFAILEIQKHCQLTNNTQYNVIELGSGVGALGRIFKLYNKKIKYFFIDIPESLYFSFLHIRLNFPNNSYKYVISNDKIDINNENIDFYFIPVKYIECLYDNKFDLFINECSLGEMNQSTVDYWFDFLQNKINLKYFYSFNRYFDDARSNSYTAYDNKWKILCDNINPKFNEVPDHPYGKYLSITHNFEKITERII